MSGKFQDSPLGKIPKDWKVKPLSELADVDRGKFSHRPRNDPRFYGGSYPFIQTSDIANASGGILTSYTQTLNERGIAVSREFPVGTIAITIAANIADTAILGIPMFFPDSVVGAVVKEPNSIRYVESCIRRAKQQLDARAPQSAQKNINLEDLRPLLIAVPEPEEQQQIAKILDTVDKAIALIESHIAKLKQVKAGLMHDLLTRGIDENGELRDPIKHPEQFQNSPVGKIPKEWGFGKLSDFYAIPARNGLYKSAKYYGRGVLMIHMPQMFRGLEIDISDSARVDVNPTELARFSLQPGDLVFARRSLNLEGAGRCSLITELPELTTFESSIIRVRLSTEQQYPPFINYFLNSEIGFRLRLPFIRQVAVSGVSSEDIASIPVPQPHPEEQKRIVKKIKLYETRIQLKEKQCEKLKLVKKGLMSDLLTGRVRVKIPTPE